MKALLLGALLVGCVGVRAADPEPLTVFVAVDDASTATLGAFPLDRAVYARAIEAARDQGARAMALKFFFDQARAPESDRALADAERELPVLLQIEGAADDGGRPLPGNLVRDDWDLARTPQPLKMDAVELPLPRFVSAARALGFVDARPDDLAGRVEVTGVVHGRAIASLQVAIVELAIGRHAVVADNRLEIGISSFALDGKGRVGCDAYAGPPPRVFGIDALLAGSIPPDAIQGKVVVLGYLRKDAPAVDVRGAKVPAHEIFYRQVACLARKAGGR